jgi:hypothetical protein
MHTESATVLIQLAPWIFIIAGVAGLSLNVIWRSQLVRFYKWNHQERAGRLYRRVLPARWYASLDAYWGRPDSQIRKRGEVACSMVVIIVGVAWILMRR